MSDANAYLLRPVMTDDGRGPFRVVEYDADVHPFLVGTQAHPELKSRPTRPHPLFAAFVGAALDYKAAERLPMELSDERHREDARSRETADQLESAHRG